MPTEPACSTDADHGVPPVVSVIVPAWNAEETLERAVASVLSQTFDRLEVVVVDDASTDRTATVAERIARGDRRVRMLRTADNGGPAAARNVGIEAARGEWIAVLDADDSFAPERLETLIDRARADGADMVADNLRLVEDGRTPCPMFEETGAPQLVTLERFLLGNLPDPRNPRVGYGFLKPIMRRAFLDRHGLRYQAGIRFAEDFGLYARCLVAGARFVLVPRPGYDYTIHGASLTANHSIDDLRHLRAMDDELLAVIQAGHDRAAERALRRHRVSIDQRLHWRVFIEDVKRRAPGAALATLLRSPAVCRYIVRRCLNEVRVRSCRRLSCGPASRRRRAAASGAG